MEQRCKTRLAAIDTRMVHGNGHMIVTVFLSVLDRTVGMPIVPVGASDASTATEGVA